MMSRCRIHQQIRFVQMLFSLRWYVELILQSRTLSLCSTSSMKYSGEEPALQCRDNLHAGLIVIEAWFRAIEGVLD